jgi:predicted aspartyl protease
VPLLHIEPRAEIIGPDGKARVLPPSHALQWQGPTAQIALHFPASVAQELVNRGKKLANPIVGEALIDTGASSSCIDMEAAAELGLKAIDVTKMNSASHSDHEVPVYFASLEILGMGARFELRVMGGSFRSQNLIALIGRDALASSVLFYDGPTGQATLVLV